MKRKLGPWSLTICGPALLAAMMAVVVPRITTQEMPPGASATSALVGLGVGLFLFLPWAWIPRPVLVPRVVTRSLSASWFFALGIVTACLRVEAGGPLFIAAFLWILVGAYLSCVLDLSPRPDPA